MGNAEYMGTCQVEGLAAWSQSPVGSNNLVFCS